MSGGSFRHFQASVAAFALFATVGASAAMADDTKSLESRVKRLEAIVADLQDRKPQLDCMTKYLKAEPSNNHTIHVDAPEGGYTLVGGSCGFDHTDWQASYNPVLLRVGPYVNADGSISRWYCYAKQGAAVGFTATATFCRVK